MTSVCNPGRARACTCTPQIVKAEGFKGLYRGVVPRLGRVIPGQGIIFMSYERIQTFVSGIVEGPK